METERVAANAAKKAGKGLGKFLAGVGTGTVAVLAAIEEGNRKERESLRDIEAAMEAHQARFGRTPGIRPTVQKCTANTAFWDCEDPNCFWHQSRKDRMGIGTPTRNYRKNSDSE